MASDTHVRRSGFVVDRFPRIWALWAAARPSQIALVVVVYGLGLGMATAGPPLIVGDPPASTTATVRSSGFRYPAALGATALLPVTVAIHYANEFADVETDQLTTRTAFSGGSGALVETGLAPSFLRSATIGAVAVASLALLSGAMVLPLDALLVLVAIFGLGLAYSLPPIAFIDRGLGELVNAILGGLLLPLYGVAVVASPTLVAVLAVLPFTLLVLCNLFGTHWPDREADARVGKRTLAVRWSARRLRRAFAGVATIAVSIAAGLWLIGVFPDAIALAHLAPIPFLVWGGAVLTRKRSPFPAVIAMVVLAITTTIGWWWIGVVT